VKKVPKGGSANSEDSIANVAEFSADASIREKKAISHHFTASAATTRSLSAVPEADSLKVLD